MTNLFKLYITVTKIRTIQLMLNVLRGEPDIESLKKLGLKVGINCKFQEELKIDSSFCWLIDIGDNVTIAPKVIILAHDASMKNHLGYVKIGKVKIGNNVFIGAGSIILPGVSIGNGTIIGAGSVVTKNIPENVVAAGNPIRILRSLNDFLDSHHDLMKHSPLFGSEFTLIKNVSNEKKLEMNKKMEDSCGYIV